MTNRDRALDALQKHWAEIQVKKNELIRELWKLEAESEQTKEKLQKYGKPLELAEKTAVVH